MALTVDTNTWLSVADADTYMALRLNADAVWDDSTTTAKKEAALATAYFQLTNDERYGLPETVVQVMKDAQCEQALFLLQNEGDLDSRQGLRAQGVRSSSVVGEAYVADGAIMVPISPNAAVLLRVYESTGGSIGSVNLLDQFDADELT